MKVEPEQEWKPKPREHTIYETFALSANPDDFGNAAAMRQYQSDIRMLNSLTERLQEEEHNRERDNARYTRRDIARAQNDLDESLREVARDIAEKLYEQGHEIDPSDLDYASKARFELALELQKRKQELRVTPEEIEIIDQFIDNYKKYKEYFSSTAQAASVIVRQRDEFMRQDRHQVARI